VGSAGQEGRAGPEAEEARAPVRRKPTLLLALLLLPLLVVLVLPTLFVPSLLLLLLSESSNPG